MNHHVISYINSNMARSRRIISSLEKDQISRLCIRWRYIGTIRPKHITEEIWQACGFEGHLYQQKWPEFEEAKTIENTIELPVQINGKTKAVVKLPLDVDKETAIAAGKEAIADKLTGTIVKEIYVPKKIINIVQK